MNGKQKTLCLQTVLTLVMIAGAIGIGYTNFVQAEIKEDLTLIRIDLEKNDVQITDIKENIFDIKILLKDFEK